MEESKLDKVIAQCEWAIRQPSPTIIEAKKFYEETLELLKEYKQLQTWAWHAVKEQDVKL